MSRNYVDCNNARFTPASFCTVRCELYTGEVFEELEPRRLFPVSSNDKFVSLLDLDGKEQMMIRSLSDLDSDSRAVILDALGDYYRIPVITAVHRQYVSNWMIRFAVTTNYGDTDIVVRTVFTDIKFLYGKRVMIKDGNDNRYEIPDLYALDDKSIKIMECFH